jgi:glycosyltransferase involved in cell wall biosynthesis
MSSTIRIVHAITPAPVGGLESAVRLLAGAQRAHGHAVHVVATLDGADEPSIVRDLRAAGVTVTTIAAPGRAYAREWRDTAALIERERPDIVHTHGYRADLLAGMAARRARVPVVTTLHGFTGGDWKLRLYEKLQRRALPRFDAVVAVSARMADDLGARGAAMPLHVIPNAYAALRAPMTRDDARRALGIPAERFEIGWVGRFSHEKGPDVMVRALSTRAARGAHVSMIGDGPTRASVMALADAQGVRDRVSFHGTRLDAAALLPAFDAFVLSSRSEGTPIVLFEAMAARVPVIATRVGGVPDVVHSEHARLVAPEDGAALAEAIEEIRANPSDAARRAERAAARLEKTYDVGGWIRAYDRVYTDAMMHGRERSVA